MVYCINCGTSADEGKFCAQCGTALKWPTAGSTSVTSPEAAPGREPLDNPDRQTDAEPAGPSATRPPTPQAPAPRVVWVPGDDRVAPTPGATFGEAVALAFRRYAVFRGRASRSEYWYWVLFSALISSAAGLFAALVGNSSDAGAGLGGVLVAIAVLGLFLPGLAVTSRRLHDANLSAALILLALIPYLGSLIVIVLSALPSSIGANRYGPSQVGVPQAPR